MGIIKWLKEFAGEFEIDMTEGGEWDQFIEADKIYNALARKYGDKAAKKQMKEWGMWEEKKK